MTPSVNRQVHYVSAGSMDGKYPPVCRAATITEVSDAGTEHAAEGRVGLMVVNPTGIHFRPLVEGGARHLEPEQDEALQPYTWHWPERV